MRRKFAVGMAVVMFITAILVSACTRGAGGQTEPQGADATVSKPAKPALVVPESFENEKAKRDFAIVAMADAYYKEAEKLLNELVTATPEAKTLKQLGSARYMLKDYEGAMAAWSKAAELDPALEGEMLNNKANVLRDINKIDEAKETYRQAIAADRTLMTAASNLATLLREEGKLTEAIEVLNQAAVANPKDQIVASMLESYKSSLANN